MQISRRGLLLGAAAGGGLVIAWSLWPRDFAAPLATGQNEYGFDAWLKIGADGVVTVAVPQLEMGQGVSTILPQIVATELGADWRQIAVQPAPPSGAYANVPLAARWSEMWMPFGLETANPDDDFLAEKYAQSIRFSATADGTTLAAFEQPCREAAASARAVLSEEAADRWGVAVEECYAGDGFIRHGKMQASFASLASGAAERDLPDTPPLSSDPALEHPLPGAESENIAFPRLDLPSKVDGSYLFAGDVRLPDMLYAAIRHGPHDKAELTSFKSEAISDNSSIKGVVKGKRWLAAVATSWWSADKALDVMEPRFDVEAVLESSQISRALEKGRAQGMGYRIATRGTGGNAMKKPSFARRYDVGPGVHAPLETASATARFADGKLELWLASQAPEAARQAAANAIGLDYKDVVLYPMPAGGSFDARLEHSHAIEIASIAQEMSPKPVQLIWSRWQELLAELPRSPASALVAAETQPGGRGRMASLHIRIAVPATAREFGERLFSNKTSWAARQEVSDTPDPLAVEGAMPHYDIPAAAVTHVPVDTGLSSGRLRGNAHGMSAFFLESFVDEIAEANNREPLSYRVEMLSEDLSMVSCLQRVARLAQWDGGRTGSGQGLACHRMEASSRAGRIACVATARRDEGGLRVIRLAAVADIGRIINLDIARQQIEGGLIFGMAQAMGASTEYQDGLPTSRRLAQLNLPGLADCPEIAVDFVASDEPPFDPGELGAVVAPPAIANALFSATGLRFRRLPLLSEGL